MFQNICIDIHPFIPPKKIFKSLPYLAKFYLQILDINVASLFFYFILSVIISVLI